MVHGLYNELYNAVFVEKKYDCQLKKKLYIYGRFLTKLHIYLFEDLYP